MMHAHIRAWLTVVCLLVSSPLYAQPPIVNATRVEFVSSTHTSTGGLSGTPLVTRYLLNCTGTGGTPITNKDLGKPPANAANLVGPVSVPEFASITEDVVYTCTVTAEGPGGVAVSGASNPFGRPGALPPPAAPTGVVVKP